MVTHHVDIYHCQRCGRMSSRKQKDKPPTCCGEGMSRAVANITYEDESREVAPPEEVIEKSHQLEPSKRK